MTVDCPSPCRLLDSSRRSSEFEVFRVGLPSDNDRWVIILSNRQAESVYRILCEPEASPQYA